jgi:ectoine hydroxylase-related dioxygenase (phytanoyl-CoA dioxygenase family)
MHSDQGRIVSHFACVQGAVNLYSNESEDGGTLLMQGSHSKFSEYCASHPIDGIKAFFPIDPEDSLLADCPVIKPCLNEGEILLWDSRTFHCNVTPVSQHPRMCIYVSMMPKSYAAEYELQKRRKLAQGGRMTGHWCYGPFFSINPKEPNPMYTKDLPQPQTEIAEMTPARKALIG